MKTMIAGAVGLLILLAPARAGAPYDVKIETAAKELIARRIGEIRPGFAYDQAPPAQMDGPRHTTPGDVASSDASRHTKVFWFPRGQSNEETSRTVGSIQTFGNPNDAPKGHGAAKSRSGAIPRVLKF